jgi:hypothetical protein
VTLLNLDELTFGVECDATARVKASKVNLLNINFILRSQIFRDTHFSHNHSHTYIHTAVLTKNAVKSNFQLNSLNYRQYKMVFSDSESVLKSFHAKTVLTAFFVRTAAYLSRRGSRGFSDIPERRPRFTKII